MNSIVKLGELSARSRSTDTYNTYLEHSNMYDASATIIHMFMYEFSLSGCALCNAVLKSAISPISILFPLCGAATMPMALTGEDDHYFLLTIIDDVFWFVGYCGLISDEDFAYGCQSHANGGAVVVPGASKLCYAFKCTAAGPSLFVVDVVVFGSMM